MIRISRRNGMFPVFSNFYDSPVTYDNVIYRNNEGAFQAQKTLDKEDRLRFCSMSGSQAKKAGRAVSIRSDWESVKYGIMVDLCYDKFSRDECLKNLLLITGNDWIVEDTTEWHDNTWGMCNCSKCADKWSSNLLGQALMTVRSCIRGDFGTPVHFVLSGKEFNFDLNSLPEMCGDSWYETLDKINRFSE